MLKPIEVSFYIFVYLYALHSSIYYLFKVKKTKTNLFQINRKNNCEELLIIKNTNNKLRKNIKHFFVYGKNSFWKRKKKCNQQRWRDRWATKPKLLLLLLFLNFIFIIVIDRFWLEFMNKMRNTNNYIRDGNSFDTI